MFGVNDTVARNAEAYLGTPAEFPPNYNDGDALTSAEGGFRPGDSVIVDNPDDFYHGRKARCVEARTPRTMFIAVEGRTLRYCISSLRHV